MPTKAELEQELEAALQENAKLQGKLDRAKAKASHPSAPAESAPTVATDPIDEMEICIHKALDGQDPADTAAYSHLIAIDRSMRSLRDAQKVAAGRVRPDGR